MIYMQFPSLNGLAIYASYLYAHGFRSTIEQYLIKNLHQPSGLFTVLDVGSSWRQGWAILDWLKTGSESEDEPDCRPSNHFHNPLKPWSASYMIDCPGHVCNWCDDTQYPITRIKSSIHWATGYIESAPGGARDETGNGWDWDHAREYFHIFLTGRDFHGNDYYGGMPGQYSRSDAQVSNFYYGRSLQALGQVLHLLQDMAVPAHVRSDFQSHLDWVGLSEEVLGDVKALMSDRFELYVKNHEGMITGNLGGDLDAPSVTDFWDSDNYTGDNPAISLTPQRIGLAEYTHMNFASKKTVFSDGFLTDNTPSNDIYYHPYPAKSSTNVQQFIDQILPPETITAEDGQADSGFWVRKTGDGESGYRFARASYLASEGIWEMRLFDYLPYYFSLDDATLRDYASLLLPRAIGYSANLLNYFFRGSMELKGVDLMRECSGDIVGMNLEVKNTSRFSEEIEAMKGGTLSLAYRYVPLGGTKPVYGFMESIYTIIDVDDPINADFVPVSVAFPTPIPSNAQGIAFTLVYRGKLGGEEEAVAARVFSLTSKIAYVSQLNSGSDQLSLCTICPDGAGKTPITDAFSDYRWFRFPTWSPDGKRLVANAVRQTSQGEDWDILALDLASGSPYPQNILGVLNTSEPGAIAYDMHPSFSSDGRKIVAARWMRGGERSGLVIFDLEAGSWHYVNSPEFWRPYTQSSPRWAPFGDAILYTLHRIDLDSYDLKLIRSDGTGDRHLTDDGFDNLDGSWCGGEERIVFLSNRDGEDLLDIWLLDLASGGMERVLDCPAGCGAPSCSPDGQRVVFTMNGPQLFTVNVDGSELRELTSGESAVGEAHWSPLLYDELCITSEEETP